MTSAPAVDSSSSAPRRRRHDILVGSIFAIAVIVGLVAVLAVWANRQALNTQNVTNTSSHILADKPIQVALSAYLVNELFNSVNVQADVRSVLPTQLQGVAGPLASGIRQLANNQAPRLLATAQIQAAFRDAVRTAHLTLLRIINGKGNLVSTNQGVVALNLRSLITQLASALGLSSQLAAAQSKLQGGAGAKARNAVQQQLGITLPPASGQLVILRSGQLKTVQDVVSAISGLAVVLPLIALALFAAAVWLAKGWRRIALRTCGWCFFGIGLFVLLLRRIGGNALVNKLVKVDANKPAVHQIWLIATSLLYDIAIAMVVYGLIIVIAAWMAGSSRPATAVRRGLAPTLRERPAWTYVTVAVGLLLIVVWGPTPAFRQVIPVVLIAALVALGVEALRRRTAAEFPQAQRGETMRAARTWYAAHRSGAAYGPSPQAGTGQRMDKLERLASLHDRGALTDSEFASQKAEIIGGS